MNIEEKRRIIASDFAEDDPDMTEQEYFDEMKKTQTDKQIERLYVFSYPDKVQDV